MAKTERHHRLAAYQLARGIDAPPEGSPAAQWVETGAGTYPLKERIAERLAADDALLIAARAEADRLTVEAQECEAGEWADSHDGRIHLGIEDETPDLIAQTRSEYEELLKRYELVRVDRDRLQQASLNAFEPLLSVAQLLSEFVELVTAAPVNWHNVSDLPPMPIDELERDWCRQAKALLERSRTPSTPPSSPKAELAT